LLYQAHRRPAGEGSLESGAYWHNTPWGRILVGLLLAQGLSHGLRTLCDAGFLAVGDAATQGVWTTLFGLILLQGLQGVSLVLGGAVAGAGQARAIFYGAIVGLWNGLLLLAVQYLNGESQTQAILYGQPPLHLLFGALGGLLGKLIWKPLPALDVPAAMGKPKVAVSTHGKRSMFSGPVAWVRVGAGVALAAGGAVWTKVILDLIVDASQGKLTPTSHLQAQLVTWEIFALGMLGGGGIAGATTSNGSKQGLCVGLGTAALLVGFSLGRPNVIPEQLVFTVSCSLALTLVGGWFGGQLFPPILAPRRKKMRAAF
jgi:hypothetical protein